MISLELHLQHPCVPSGCQYGVCDLKSGWHYLSWLTLVFVSSQSPRILLTLGCDKQLFSEIEDKTPQQNQGVYKTEAMALVNLHSLVGTLENMVLKLNSPEVTSMILQPGALPSHLSHDRIEATKIWFKYINHKEECFNLMAVSMLLNFIEFGIRWWGFNISNPPSKLNSNTFYQVPRTQNFSKGNYQ